MFVCTCIGLTKTAFECLKKVPGKTSEGKNPRKLAVILKRELKLILVEKKQSSYKSRIFFIKYTLKSKINNLDKKGRKNNP